MSKPTRRDREPSPALVPILHRSIGESANAVDARELHRALEVETRFADWISRRIADLGLVAGVDYEVSLNSEKNPSGGRPRTEYIIGLDAAKHIALAEKNQRGREIRAYFIEAEKRVRAIASATPQSAPALDLRDPMTAVALLAQSLEVLQEERSKRIAAEAKVEEQRAELVEAAPKVAALERLRYARGSLCITDAAKALQVPPRELFEFLQTRQWIYKRPGGRTWIGYQARVAQGYLVHKVWTGERDDGTEIVRERVLVTPAGLARLAEILGRDVAA